MLYLTNHNAGHVVMFVKTVGQFCKRLLQKHETVPFTCVNVAALIGGGHFAGHLGYRCRTKPVFKPVMLLKTSYKYNKQKKIFKPIFGKIRVNPLPHRDTF